jgi:hypothetical protein
MKKRYLLYAIGNVNIHLIKFLNIASMNFGMKKKIKFLREQMVNGYQKDMYLNVHIQKEFIPYF